jgi:hypothetical protein
MKIILKLEKEDLANIHRDKNPSEISTTGFKYYLKDIIDKADFIIYESEVLKDGYNLGNKKLLDL